MSVQSWDFEKPWVFLLALSHFCHPCEKTDTWAALLISDGWLKIIGERAFLEVQWLLYTFNAGATVPSLVRKQDPTCHQAWKKKKKEYTNAKLNNESLKQQQQRWEKSCLSRVTCCVLSGESASRQPTQSWLILIRLLHDVIWPHFLLILGGLCMLTK